MSGTSCCNCCTGIGQETPVTITNRPGLSQIAYRVGTWAQFKSSMLDALSSSPSLVRLKTRSDDDFSIALLDSFAVVCDILTFYSERSANEHYLGTATDIISMQELARLVGYKPAPGVAAGTVLAVTVQSPPPQLPASPAQIPAPLLVPPVIPVSAGLQVQSVPDPGQQPVTFETVADIQARWSWNALGVRTTLPVAAVAGNVNPGYLRLQGLIGSISTGDWLLVVINQGQSVGLNRVAAVSLDNTTRTTRVTFDGGDSDPQTVAPPDQNTTPPALAGNLGDPVVQTSIKGQYWSDQTQLVASAAQLKWPIQQLEDNINALNAASSASSSAPPVQVFRLGVRASLFGHNAPAYSSLPSYTPIGSGGLTSVLPDWDSTPATVATDTNGSWTTSQRLSLDQSYPALVQGGWVVVQAPGQSTQIAQIGAVATVSRTGFLLSGRVTQLQLSGAAQSALANFPIRTTSILGATDAYLPAEVPVGSVSQATITLASAQLGLQPGQQIVITGSAQGQSGRQVSELHTIQTLALVDGYTQIGLDSNLQQNYAPSSVTINANIAPATHGQTRSEILGSGSGGAIYQQFVLKQPPLTYVSASTPSGVASTLQVRVNGVAWSETGWLAGEGASSQVFTTSLDSQDNTIVEFGDGSENGARLPTGQNNITATYRQGIGSVGNLRAGQLTTLLTRPTGVQSVINPIPASGGGDPDSVDSARGNVPVTTRALDRIVSLEDVGDFARSSAAIAKAEAVWTWNGRRQVACVTVSGPAGAGIDPTSEAFTNLQKAMRGASDGTFPIVLCTYTPRTFTVGATLTIDPTLDSGAVIVAAKTALVAAFGFEARDFMQPVYLSEVLAVLQAVPGVIALTVDAFAYSDGTAATDSCTGCQGDMLIAAPPTMSGTSLVGAQLLTIESGLLPGVVAATGTASS
jgi:predicted phage baseplate assembly protein